MAMMTLNSGQTFQEKVDPRLDIKAAFYTPFLNRYKMMVGEMPTRSIFLNESLSNNQVALNGAYTAGSGTMTLAASTNLNNYQITEGSTHIETTDGAAVYKILTFNTSSKVATIQLTNGSDASLASGVTMNLAQYDRYAAEYGVTNEGDNVPFSTSDINYPSFIYQRLKAGDLNENRSFTDIGWSEANISHQENKKYAQLMLQLERNLFYSTKTEGSSPATRQGNKISSGLDSKAGGLAGFISAQGGRVADNTSTSPVSEADIISDVEFVRSVGGLTQFLNFDRNENQMAEIDLYCHESILGDINKFVRLERDEKALSAQKNGEFGSWATRLIAGGAYVNVYSSSGPKTVDYFMIPSGINFEALFVSYFKKILIGKTGANTKCMYETIYTLNAPNAYTCVHRKNLARLGA